MKNSPKADCSVFGLFFVYDVHSICTKICECYLWGFCRMALT